MTLVSWVASGTYMSPRVHNIIFQFLSHALEIKDMYKHAKDHWDGILHNVAFPMMCFNEQDAQLWEEDPHEYIRKVWMGSRGGIWAGLGPERCAVS